MIDYQKLKQVIQEANPEIMELKIGCKVLKDGKVWDVLRAYDNYAICWNGNVHHPLYKDEIINLGRDIRIADVCLAFLKRSDVYPSIFEELNQLFRKWRLEEDNLDHQSSELKEYLIEAFKV